MRSDFDQYILRESKKTPGFKDAELVQVKNQTNIAEYHPNLIAAADPVVVNADLFAGPANCPELAQFTPECLFHNSVRLYSLSELARDFICLSLSSPLTGKEAQAFASVVFRTRILAD